MTYALISKVRAARKINIPNPGAKTHEMLHCFVRQVLAVPKVKIM